MKTCTKCGETKEFSEFFAHKEGKFGREATCKACKLVQKKNREAKRSSVKESIGSKQCSTCRETKPRSDFSKKKSTPDGHQYNCRDCMVEEKKQFKENNPTLARERQKKLYDKRDKKKSCEATRNWQARNAEKVAAIANARNEKRRLATELRHLGDEPVEWVTE